MDRSLATSSAPELLAAFWQACTLSDGGLIYHWLDDIEDPLGQLSKEPLTAAIMARLALALPEAEEFHVIAAVCRVLRLESPHLFAAILGAVMLGGEPMDALDAFQVLSFLHTPLAQKMAENLMRRCSSVLDADTLRAKVGFLSGLDRELYERLCSKFQLPLSDSKFREPPVSLDGFDDALALTRAKQFADLHSAVRKNDALDRALLLELSADSVHKLFLVALYLDAQGENRKLLSDVLDGPAFLGGVRGQADAMLGATARRMSEFAAAGYSLQRWTF